MKQLKYLAFLLLASFLTNSCIDDINLNIDNDVQLLTVDGLIADSLQEYTIKVSLSAIIGVSTDDLKTPVSNASVIVYDDAGGAFEFTEGKAGVYTRTMQGEVGKSYYVEVKTPEGKTIRSKPSILPPSAPLLDPSVSVSQNLIISSTGRSYYDNRLVLAMNADLSGIADPPYLRWRAQGEYEFGENYPGIINRKICYVKTNIDFNNIRIFDAHDLSDGKLNNEPFLNLKYDYHFAFQYCFHLLQYSLSEEEYKYWENVRDIVTTSGSIYDPPPGTVRGNLYNTDDPNEQIMGYFSVDGLSTRRFFTNAVDLNVAAAPRCSTIGGFGQDDYAECYNCLLIPFSITERPWYWKP